MDDLTDGVAPVVIPPELVAVAARADGAGVAVAGVPGGPAPVDLAGELEGLGGLVVLVMSKRWPWVMSVWSPSDVSQIAVAMAAVCEKHGWLAGGVGGGPEMMLALALAGPVIATAAKLKEGSQDGGAASSGE